MNNNYRKRSHFFANKICNLCGKPAIIFRLINSKSYMLCDSKECEKITRIRAGFFSDEFNGIKIIKTK